MEHARLTVTLRPTTGTLARLASTLNNHRVLDLAFSAAAPAPARAVVRVPRPEAVRVQQKLRRMVDVLDVALEPAGPAEDAVEVARAEGGVSPVGGRGR
ncbi:hypothetical protein ACFZDG_38975 [Kitasatospora xanthocidica]|uniref:hypothetical protein n=1 Tax=Kitasatospora xanthocidica TaxID=83382 RepID=UPI0036EDE80C